MFRVYTQVNNQTRLQTIVSQLIPSTTVLNSSPNIQVMTTAAASSSSSTPKELQIDIISDNICPFCYLGKKKIESAVSKLVSASSTPITVKYNWLPFELDSSLPKEGVNKMERYEKKFGKERIEGMLNGMKKNGKDWDINFDYGGKVGNTINSHRLVEYVKKLDEKNKGEGKYNDALMNSLFNGYFERQQDISDNATLVNLAEQANPSVIPTFVSSSQLTTFLQSDELRKEVNDEIEQGKQQHQVSGVPHFIIANKFEVSGAQDPDAFLQIFKKAGF